MSEPDAGYFVDRESRDAKHGKGHGKGHGRCRPRNHGRGRIKDDCVGQDVHVHDQRPETRD